MKVTGLRQSRLGELPSLRYVRVHTDEGIGRARRDVLRRGRLGLRFTSGGLLLLGRDPLPDRAHWQALDPFLGFDAAGAPGVRHPLWDLLRRVCGQPIHQCGGASRDRDPRPRPCAGYTSARGAGDRGSSRTGTPSPLPAGPRTRTLMVPGDGCGLASERACSSRHHRHEDLRPLDLTRRPAASGDLARGPAQGHRTVPQGCARRSATGSS